MLKLFRRSSKAFKIKAVWDEEASVWYVAETNVPGLHAEAETQEELLEVLRELIPELVTSYEAAVVAAYRAENPVSQES